MDSPPYPFDQLWFLMPLGLIVGLALGSFVTALSYRLPRRISINKPARSFCPACKTALTAKDLVPVISWVCSGGKCSHCGKKISARYPLIELATGLCSMVAFGLIGFQPLLPLAVIGIVAVITAVTIKIEK